MKPGQIFRIAATAAIILLNGTLIYGEQKKQDTIRIGLIADPQYADSPDRGPRHFRSTLQRLDNCISTLNASGTDFIITLGDLTDHNPDDLDKVLEAFAKSKSPVYHTLGNHDFTKVNDISMLTQRLSMPAAYYSISRNGWKFIFLDSNDISTYSHKDDKGRKRELEKMLSDIERSGGVNAKTWNGGIGKKQMKWLTKELKQGSRDNCRILVFAHHPIWPESVSNCLNDKQILSLLESFPSVMAYICGHHHPGNFETHGTLPCITIEGMIEGDSHSSYSVMEITPDKLTIVTNDDTTPFVTIQLD